MEKRYTCEEVAQMYDVKLSTVWSWVRTNKLRAVRAGKFYRIRQTDLDEFENSRKTF